jgi:hypothetical protein
MTMLLGDLIASLDDAYVAEEVLMGLGDLALMRRASDAARENDLDLGASVSIAVRRYLNRAPPDEWTSLMSAMERSDNPASVLLKRALAIALDHDRHAVSLGEGEGTSGGSGEAGEVAS